MIDPDLIRTDPERVKSGAAAKGVTIDLETIQQLDWQQRSLQAKIDALRAKRNKLSIEDAKAQGPKLKTELRRLEESLQATSSKLQANLSAIPNLPNPDVPVAPDAKGNVVVRTVGQKPTFDFSVKDHLALGEGLGILDFERAAKVSGSRFVYRLGDLVLLELGIIKFAFDECIKFGFKPILPPMLIREEQFWGMARLDQDQKDERYHLENDDLYLIGSAEHTIGPFHAGEILNEADLPRRYLGFSSCFRREAGSYGQDVRGMLRLHQFDKVEMFVFTTPEESDAELDRLVGWQESLMRGLKLPYQVVQISTGDMGWPDASQYDLETWLPGQNRYRETHSASNTTDYQARRLNIRYRPSSTSEVNKDHLGGVFGAKAHTRLVHMLNATALALSRTVIAIMENYQRPDGTITVPEVLVPYTGFEVIGEKRQ